MKLSSEAIKGLGLILTRQAEKVTSDLDQDELNEIGELLLTVLAEDLKIKSKNY